MDAAQTPSRWSLLLLPIVCVTLLTVYLVQFPSLTLHPEPYGETGTDFYYQARYLGAWDNFWVSHGGYLPWLQRACAVAAVKIFRLHEFFSFGVQWFALVFVAASCALLCLQPFERVSASVVVRALLAIMIGVLPEYNLYSYVNFAYFGIIFVLYMLLRRGDNRPIWSELLLFAFLALVSCTKTFFIAFLPIFIGRVVWDCYRGRNARGLLWLLPIASQCCQLTFMYMHRGLYTKDPATDLTFLQRAVQAVYFSFYSFGNVLVQNRSIIDSPSASSLIAWSFAGVLLVLTAFLVCLKKREWRQAGWLMLLTGLAGASLFLATVMMPLREFDWTMPAFLDQGRWFLFAYVLILLCLFSSLNVLVRGRLVTLVCAGYLLVASWGSVGRMNDLFADERNSFSQWRRYSRLLAHDAYCVPLNPYPWLLGRKCHYLDEEGVDLMARLSPNGDIRAADVSSIAETRELIGVVVTLPEQLARSAKITARATKKDGIGSVEATEISAPGSMHRYLIFEPRLESWSDLALMTDGLHPGLPAGSKLRVMGTYP